MGARRKTADDLRGCAIIQVVKPDVCIGRVGIEIQAAGLRRDRSQRHQYVGCHVWIACIHRLGRERQVAILVERDGMITVRGCCERGWRYADRYSGRGIPLRR